MKSVKRKGRKGRRGRKKSVKRGGAKETKIYPGIGTYVGNIENGMKQTDPDQNDTGKMTYDNGDVYVGDWKNDMKHGYNGTMKYAEGDTKGRRKFFGEFNHDNLDQGSINYVNGDKYSGKFMNDMKSGYGKMVYKNGEIYAGDWLNDMRDTRPRQGERENFATMFSPSGEEKEGFWRNNELVSEGRIPPPVVAPPPVDVTQIHNFTANINFDKLNTFLKDHSSHEDPYIEQPKIDKIDPNNVLNNKFGDDIKGSMNKIIKSADNTKIKERENDFKLLMENTLDKIKYKVFTPELLTGVFLSLKYAQLQTDDAFKEAYVESYLDDTCKAHGDDKTIDNFSCPAGAFERFVTSLSPAATAALLSDGANEKQKQEYEQLVVMITRNPKTLIPNLIRQWQISHRNGINFNDIVGREARRADLDAYINQNNTIQELIKEEKEGAATDENSKNEKTIAELIEESIVNHADSIGYENDDFYLGGRRTRKRRRRTKKMAKTKKRKPRKRKGAK